jgi:CBS domain-containing protein
VAELRDIMTRKVVTTSSDAVVSEVADRMVQARVGSAVIMQGSWLVGIVTERDVLRAAASGQDLTGSAVSNWMTKDPTTAPADMDSDEAAQIMVANGFRHLPVVDGKELLGVVSIRDVLSARIRRRG